MQEELLRIINFEQGDAGRISNAAHKRRVASSRQRCEDNRLMGIGRSKATGSNLRGSRVLPIIVGCDQSAAAIAQFEQRILQRLGYSGG